MAMKTIQPAIYSLGPNMGALTGMGTTWAPGQSPYSFDPMMDQAGLSPQQDPYNWGNVNPADLALLGWNTTPGARDPLNGFFNTDPGPNDGSSGGADYIPQNSQSLGYSPAALKSLQDKDITSKIGSGDNGYAQQFFGPGGQPLGQGTKWNDSADPTFLAAMAAALAMPVAAVAGGAAAGAAGAGGEAAAGGAGELGAGLAGQEGLQSGIGAAGGFGQTGAAVGGVSAGAANGQMLTPAQQQMYLNAGQQASDLSSATLEGGAYPADLAGYSAPDGAASLTGSDAHFLHPTAGEGGLGNMGGVGTQSLPFTQLTPQDSSWLTQLMGNGGNASQASTLAKLLGGSGGSGSNAGVGTALAAALAAFANGGGGSVGTPDYMAAARAQGLSARTDQSNPYGSLKYTQTGVDASGNPTYKQDVSLTPQTQSNFQSAQGAQGTALGNWGDVLKNAGADWSSIPGVYGGAGSQDALIKQAQDAVYNTQARYLDPQYQQQQQSLTSSLANQGITMGSAAYQNAMDNFERNRQQAYAGARDQAVTQGNQFAGQLFNQGLQTHNAGVSDWTTHLGTTANAATAAGQQANSFNPSFATAPQPTNFLGAAALQGQGNLNQYNATTGAQNSQNNGLFNLAGSVLSNPNWTDLIGKFFSGGGP